MTQHPDPDPETGGTTANEKNEAADKSAASPVAETRNGTPPENLDLSPEGLKDAPAEQEDEQSLVDPGNS